MLAKTHNQPLTSPAESERTIASEQRTRRISLVKGPVGVIGLLLLGYGVTGLIFGGHGFGQHAPNGAVHGSTWLGLELNGWSGLLFVAAGLLLLLATPLHWAAKGMSLIVGLVLGAAAVIALAKGDGVLGVFAANHLTELVWGATAALLIVLSLLPRVGGNPKKRFSAAKRAERGARVVEPEPPQTDAIAANAIGTRTLVAPASGTTPESTAEPH